VTRKDIDITDDQHPRKGERLFKPGAVFGVLATMLVIGFPFGAVYVWRVYGFWSGIAVIGLVALLSGVIIIATQRHQRQRR